MTSLIVMWGLVFSFPSDYLNFAIAASDDEDDKEKEEEAEEIEDDVENLEDDLEKALKEKAVKEQEKLLISNELWAIRKNITVVEADIEETGNEIKKLEREIVEAIDEIALKKKLMGAILRQINRTNRELQLIAYGKESGLSEYFSIVDGLENMEGKLSTLIVEVRQKKEDLEKQRIKQKEGLALHDDQKELLEYQKNKKGWVLSQKQQAINEDASEIGQIQAKISKMKSEISKLLGKGYDASDIKSAVKYASKKTGVRRDFLMGMLVVESNLGRFTGGCNYKESRMSDYRKTIFKQICKEVDRNYKKMKVSCPPSNYKGTGGAMGVQQFMSDTWLGYKDRISEKTGNYPPDPWNLTDGVMAMAIKLGNDGATKKSGEWRAASRYLGTCHTKTTEFYCRDVLYWADNYEKVLN
ncbi:hypothetical protein HN569_03230 [bacterium]|nr:hypothetical protein [bacterium]